MVGRLGLGVTWVMLLTRVVALSPFSFLLFLCFWWCTVVCWVFGCFGMWGNVSFALVSAFSCFE